MGWPFDTWSVATEHLKCGYPDLSLVLEPGAGKDHGRLERMPLGDLFRTYQPLTTIPFWPVNNKVASIQGPFHLVINTFLPIPTVPQIWQPEFIHQGLLSHWYSVNCVTAYSSSLRHPIFILPTPTPHEPQMPRPLHFSGHWNLEVRVTDHGPRGQFVPRDMLGWFIFQMKFGSTLKVKGVIKMTQKLRILLISWKPFFRIRN